MPWSPMQNVSMLNGALGTRHWSPCPVAVLYIQAAPRSGSVQPLARGSWPQNSTAGRLMPAASHSLMNAPAIRPVIMTCRKSAAGRPTPGAHVCRVGVDEAVVQPRRLGPAAGIGGGQAPGQAAAVDISK